MDDCRKAFEAHWKMIHGWVEPIHGSPFTYLRDGNYGSGSIQADWTLWQAAWNSRTPEPVELQEQCERLSGLVHFCINKFYDADLNGIAESAEYHLKQIEKNRRTPEPWVAQVREALEAGLVIARAHEEVLVRLEQDRLVSMTRDGINDIQDALAAMPKEES